MRFDNINDKMWMKDLWTREKMKALASESADFLSYFDLFLSNNTIDIFAALTNKFNKVSEEMDCPQFKL